MRIDMKYVHDDRGFVLVLALMIMVALTFVGLMATNNMVIEKTIAINDRTHKKTFYDAEGAMSLGSELLEQSFSCLAGFPNATLGGTIVNVKDLTLWDNPLMDSDTIKAKINDPVNQNDVSFSFPAERLLPSNSNFLYYGGETNVLPGGALEMAAGYEGKGKSAAQGGVAKLYDIYSQSTLHPSLKTKGYEGAESIILLGWRHLVGTEGSCPY